MTTEIQIIQRPRPTKTFMDVKAGECFRVDGQDYLRLNHFGKVAVKLNGLNAFCVVSFCDNKAVEVATFTNICIEYDR